jgi:hypothetical protein
LQSCLGGRRMSCGGDTWRLAVGCADASSDVSVTWLMTSAVDRPCGLGPPVYRGPIQRGAPPFNLGRPPDRAAGGAMARAAALQGAARDGCRRRARRKIAGDSQKNFPCTKIHGKITKMKRRTWGAYREAWKGGRGTGGIDRAARWSSGGELRRRRCRGVEERKGGAQGGEEIRARIL